jgi:hypothetical protein
VSFRLELRFVLAGDSGEVGCGCLEYLSTVRDKLQGSAEACSSTIDGYSASYGSGSE